MTFRVLLFAVMVAPLTLWAHTPLLLVQDNDAETIYIEAGFSDGGSAAGMQAILRERGTGRLLGEHTFPEASYLIVPRPRVPYTVTFDSGAEHKLTRNGPWKAETSSVVVEPQGPVSADDEAIDVLTGLPVTYFLASRLTQNTTFRVTPIFPASVGFDEQPLYLQEQEATLQPLFAQAELVLSLRQFVPQDVLYRWVRRHNPRAVELDAAFPFDPSATAVRLQRDEAGAVLPYLWLSLQNLTRMAEIIAHDLQKWQPQQAETIRANLTTLRQALQALRAETSQQLLQAEAFEVIALGHDFAYLWQEFDLYVAVSWPEPLTNTVPAALRSRLQDASAPVVVQRFEMSPALEASFRAMQKPPVTFAPLDFFPHKPEPEFFFSQLRAQLGKLVQAYQQASAR